MLGGTLLRVVPFSSGVLQDEYPDLHKGDSDYLSQLGGAFIIDPEQYEDTNGEQGYLRVDKGDRIELGRISAPYITDSLSAIRNNIRISRYHLRVEISDDRQILFKDLDSTNGTGIRVVEKDGDYNNDSAIKSIEAAEVEYNPTNKLGTELSIIRDIIYASKDLLSEGHSSVTDLSWYQVMIQGAGEIVKLSDDDIQYMEDSIKEWQNLRRNGESSVDLYGGMHEGWISYFSSAGSPQNITDGKMGRIYLNGGKNGIKILHGVAEMAEKKRIPLMGKTEEPYEAFRYKNSPHRADGTVLYFKSAYSTEVFDLIEQFYADNASLFVDSTPFFTSQLRMHDNTLMKGVAFGQEPIYTGRPYESRSFSSQRADLVHNSECDISIDNIPFEQAIVEAWQRKKTLDPRYVSFNTGGLKEFKPILYRLAVESFY